MLSNLQKYKGIAWLPVCLWYGLITYLSHQDSDTLSQFSWLPWDKFSHFIAYFILGILLLLPYEWRMRSFWKLLSMFGLGLLLSSLDEWHQSFIPGREASGADILADMIGFGLALVVGFHKIGLFINRLWQKVRFYS